MNAECPDCGSVLDLNGFETGELITCSDCALELEVTHINPPKLAVAPQIEEDFGE
ncbi:lysine biosynthesis protein LysW [Deinococcus roseus]|uniref:Lysine biosynthesis protein LysW n=1 Tax=Deinococcus roseus TaxID=392414 RepID=A0ABQ2DAC1_9DEIO|nr:lysine biosynthesis protein LysW [Deinococcus roseus]GGJ51094.1 hypothetical protein GCM10008938_41400 [Deinococcus roseus]